jgi:rhamnose transport system substrate-binding protein
MKRTLSILLVLILVVGMFAGCQAKTKDAEDIKIGMIPKFTGVDYFIACENGAYKAAEDLGVTVDWQGDPSGQETAANQQAYIQTFIDKEYDAILVSALDAESYADTLKAAMASGILVLTWDADVNPEARDYFVNQTENADIGSAMMSGMANSFSEDGKVVVVSSDPNASNQNAWIAAIKDEYEAKKDSDYSHITFIDEIIYAGNNQADADTAVNTVMTQNPDLKGVFALSSMATPATVKASEDLGKEVGEVGIAALGVPVTSVDAMESGLMPTVVLWQPYDLGYLAVNLAVDLLTGKVEKGMTEYASALSGNSQIGDTNYPAAHKITEDGQVILGPSIAFGMDNYQLFRGYPDATSGLE